MCAINPAKSSRERHSPQSSPWFANCEAWRKQPPSLAKRGTERECEAPEPLTEGAPADSSLFPPPGVWGPRESMDAHHQGKLSDYMAQTAARTARAESPEACVEKQAPHCNT